MPNGLRLRQSANRLTGPGLQRFVQAIAALKQISEQRPWDERGYNYIAGIHGFPLEVFCQHGTPLFLPWHRAYLYNLELAMNDLVPGAAIPWWDWVQRPGHDPSLPGPFATPVISGAPNPLFNSPIYLADGYYQWLRQNLPGTIDDAMPPRTVRDPDPISWLPTGFVVDSILRAPTFEDFSFRLEYGPHGDIHVWVGGSMSQVPTAAFDCIFFAHHAMIDRLWYLWQISDFGTDPPASLMNVVLRPFNMTVAQTLNINLLGYEYALAGFV